MKDRLFEIITKDNYGDPQDCFCVGCIFFKTKADLFEIPQDKLFTKAKENTYEAITYLNELVNEDKISPSLETTFVAAVILEEVLEKKDLTMDELRDNALILGYIHTFIQFLWTGQKLKNRNPKIDDTRMNKLMFRCNYVDVIEPIQIGLESNDMGFVVFEPRLLDNFEVEMGYKFIGHPKGFGCFEDVFN